MPKETFVVAYEGPDDDGVIDYAATRAAKDDAKLLIAHVLEWSPYSFLTPEELAERHKRRTEELARAEESLMKPALALARKGGLEAESDLRYGSVVDSIVNIAKESGASMIFVGRTGGGGGVAARVFGSVPIGLAQVAPVPTVIVP